MKIALQRSLLNMMAVVAVASLMHPQTWAQTERPESTPHPDVAEIWTFGNLATAGFGFKDGGYHGIRLELYTNGAFKASCVSSFGILSKRQMTTEDGNWKRSEDRLLLTKQGSTNEVDLREYFKGLPLRCHIERVYPRPAGYEWFRILDIGKSYYNKVYHRRSYYPHGPSVDYYPGTTRVKCVNAFIMGAEKSGRYVFYTNGNIAVADVVANARTTYCFYFNTEGNPLGQLLIIDNTPFEGMRYCFGEDDGKEKYDIRLFFTNEMIKRDDPKYHFYVESYEHGRLIRTDKANQPAQATAEPALGR